MINDPVEIFIRYFLEAVITRMQIELGIDQVFNLRSATVANIQLKLEKDR